MRKLYLLIFSYIHIIISAQVTISVETEKTEYHENEDILVKVLLKIVGKNLIQETPLRMFDTSKFYVIANGSEQNTYLDPKNGNNINQTTYQWILRPKKSGIVKIGSASVVVNEKIYYTEPFDLTILPSSKKISKETPCNIKLDLKLNKKEVYKNQETIAVLRAYSTSINELRKVNEIETPDQENIKIQKTTNLKDELEKKGNFVGKTVGVYVLYFNELGEQEVEPFSMLIENGEKKIESNSSKVLVLNLPNGAPKNYKNAVGNFQLKIKKSKTEIESLAKPIEVIVELSGAGNLDILEMPKLAKSADYTFYAPKIKKNISLSSFGTKGTIEATYIIIPKKIGKIQVKSESFSFFQPNSQEFVEIPPKVLDIEIASKEELLNQESTLDKVSNYTQSVFENVNYGENNSNSIGSKTNKKYSNGLIIFLLGIILILILIIIFLRKFKNNKQKHSNHQKQIIKNHSTIQEIENDLKSKEKLNIEEYTIYLQNTLDSNNFTLFFSGLSELNTAIMKAKLCDNYNDFIMYLTNNFGMKTSQEYENIHRKIEIEKFNPNQQKENLYDILQFYIRFYREIS